LDVSVVATGFVGGDRGANLLAVLDSKGIQRDFVAVATPTRQCTTVIDQAAGTITELVEESRPVPAAAYDELKSIVRKRTPGCRAVVMSGTLTPGAPPDFYRWCTETAIQAGALPILDAQGAPLVEALSVQPGLVKPNRTELAATVGKALTDQTAVISAMHELHQRGARQVVVTAGREPTLAFDGHKVWSVASPAVAAVNPIGSGDAFTAALTWRLLRGDDLGEACRWAAAAGAANALTLLAGEIDPAEMERLAQHVTVARL
jgi:tagatose 6-phosphate kinase